MSGSTAPKFDRSSEQLQGTATSGLALSRPGAVSAGIWVLVLAAAVGLGIALLGGGAQARSIAQLACFVVLLVLVARLSFVGIPVPRAVWLGAACAGLSGFALRHVALGISEHAFVVAQLQEDTLGAEAKIVRDRMRSAAVGLSFLSVGTLSKKISTRQEAESVLRNERSVDGTVWGSPRWLNVTLRMRPPLSLKDMFAFALNNVCNNGNRPNVIFKCQRPSQFVQRQFDFHENNKNAQTHHQHIYFKTHMIKQCLHLQFLINMVR